MGSGHILVYAFDVLMQIYEAQGYSQRDAAKLIVEKNLYGIDIDKRAYQLAYFSVMMKARQYNRRILNGEIAPNLIYIQDSNSVCREHLQYFGWAMSKIESNNARTQLEYLLDTFKDATEYGSILHVDPLDWGLLYEYTGSVEYPDQVSLDELDVEETKDALRALVVQGAILAQKYDVVVTNPPYMAVSNAGAKVNDYVKKNFPDSKADMFAVFIERCGQMAKQNGYQAMITQHAWMFLSSFEKLRTKLLAVDIVNMAHLGARAFEEIGGEVVQTTSFVIRKSHIAGYKGEYCRLIEPTSQQGKEDMFLAEKNRYIADQLHYSLIPGSPVAYWASERIIQIFSDYPSIESVAKPRQGLATGDNNKMLRLWFEIEKNKFSVNSPNLETFHSVSTNRYIPYNKGGSFRKWYGNIDNVIKFDAASYSYLLTVGNHLPSRELYFKEAITWSKVTSGGLSMRYVPQGAAFDVAGCSIFAEKNLKYILGLCNSSIIQVLIRTLSQTMNYEVGTIKAMPVIVENGGCKAVENLAGECINLSKSDWDSYETSWDFKRNPLV